MKDAHHLHDAGTGIVTGNEFRAPVLPAGRRWSQAQFSLRISRINCQNRTMKVVMRL